MICLEAALGASWHPRRLPRQPRIHQDGPRLPMTAQEAPKTASTQLTRPPRRLKRAPRGPPGEPIRRNHLYTASVPCQFSFFFVVAWAAHSGAPLRRGPFSSETEDHVAAALHAAARKAAAAWSFQLLLLSETRPCPRCAQFCRGGLSAPRFAGLGRLAAPRRPSVAIYLFTRRFADSCGFSLL